MSNLRILLLFHTFQALRAKMRNNAQLFELRIIFMLVILLLKGNNERKKEDSLHKELFEKVAHNCTIAQI